MGKTYIYKPLRYFFCVILLTGILEMIMAWFSYLPDSLYKNVGMSLFLYAGVATPFIVALFMIFSSGNNELKADFISRTLNLRRIKPHNIPLILFTVPITVVVAIILSALFMGQSLEQFNINKGFIFNSGFIPAPIILLVAPLLEELGWKGYGINSLRSKINFFNASLIFGLLWCLWHAPLFFVKDYYMNMLWKESWVYGLNYFISVISFGFLINWIWYKNRGSIIAAFLMHLSADFQGLLLMGNIAKCIQTVIMILLVIVIVCRNKEMYFSKSSKEIGYFGE